MSNLTNKEFTLTKMRPLKNNVGEIVEKYLPRKCCATSRVIGCKDHSSIQLFIPALNKDGTVNLNQKDGLKLAFSGYIRDKGRSDQELDKILRTQGYYDCQK